MKEWKKQTEWTNKRTRMNEQKDKGNKWRTCDECEPNQHSVNQT